MARKLLVLITLFLGVGIASFLVVRKALSDHDSVFLNVEGYPVIGRAKAPLEFVIFEDYRCYNCKSFNENVFPQIQQRYLDTGKAKYVVIPLAFMEESYPLANAAYAVYASSPDRFAAYSKALFNQYETEDVADRELIDIARRVGGIEISFLKKAIETRAFYAKIQEGFELADQVMKGEVHTPTLFLNGKRVSTSSFEKIEKKAEKILS